MDKKKLVMSAKDASYGKAKGKVNADTAKYSTMPEAKKMADGGPCGRPTGQGYGKARFMKG
jgi:hypothetical protein